ncbi:hypothetical protein E4U23_005130 [Claviceps purpurea]|nr:hypothetical protein E4U26_001329 [Claviceps purpurea]KAG6255035.1 hypothetical protein E4U23_005130 [Claviceps purpurea]
MGLLHLERPLNSNPKSQKAVQGIQELRYPRLRFAADEMAGSSSAAEHPKKYRRGKKRDTCDSRQRYGDGNGRRDPIPDGGILRRESC